MHKHGFVEVILKDIDNQDNVREIVLEVGELVGIEGSHLREHILERFDWVVEIIDKDSKVRCECGFEGRARIIERLHDIVIFECAQCGWVPEIIDGNEIKVLKVVYDQIEKFEKVKYKSLKNTYRK